MLDTRLFIAQRLSALILAPLVIGHLIVMVYAVQGGLSAAEILDRTRGSLWWLTFYGLFVAAVSVHGAIGLRVVAHEMLGVKGGVLNVVTGAVFVCLLVLGARAVVAVTLG